MQKLFVKKPNTSIAVNFEQDAIDKLINTIKIKQISCGFHHIIILDQKNNIYVGGRNSDGQLGLGHKSHINYFEQINKFNNNVKLISANSYFSVILTLDHKMFVSGSILKLNFSSDETSNFKEIEVNKEIKEIKKMKSGIEFIVVMDKNNELFGCGKNDLCQFGFKSKNNSEIRFSKFNIPEISKIMKDFYCGFSYTLILTQDGDVYCSGRDVGNLFSFDTFTKLDLNFKCKEIGCAFKSIYFLTFNNELYSNKEKLNFTKPIKNLYNGLGPSFYWSTEENEIYKINRTIEKLELGFIINLPYFYIYPTFDTLVVFNSDYNLEEESKEVIRLKNLLFERINTVFYKDIKIMIQ